MFEFLRPYLSLAFIAIIIAGLVGVSCYFFWVAVQDGKALRGAGNFFDEKLVSDHKEKLVSDHKGSLMWAYGLLVFAVIFIEVAVRLYGSAMTPSTLLKSHWVLDAEFVSFSVLSLCFNGRRSQYWHRRFVRVALVILSGVIGTGLVLLYQLLVG